MADGSFRVVALSVPILGRNGRVGRGTVESMRSGTVSVGGSLQFQRQAGTKSPKLTVFSLVQQLLGFLSTMK